MSAQTFSVKYGGGVVNDPEKRPHFYTIYSCEYLKQELESGTHKSGIAYFQLAHFLNTRNQQLKLLDGFKFRYGISFRKTTNKKILRIVFPK